MKLRKTVLLLLGGALLAGCSSPSEKAAGELAGRLVPAYRIEFREIKDTAETYCFYTKGKCLVIEGSSTSAMTAALGRYLRDYAHADVSWYAADVVEAPELQAVVPTPVHSSSLVKDRFFLNYCTFGYTMPWWKWEDWERFIDWMALQGVNLPLAITGQEAIWQEVWRGFGLTDEQIRAYFTGPAHLPWQRMCNIDGVDGPLPQGWIDGQKELQKRILQRERQLGMRPVLPAFAGHVPRRIKELYPEKNITEVPWCGFPEKNHCFYLPPQDSLFKRIQQDFLSIQTREFGTDHIYGMDLFNEVEPPSWNPDTLASIAALTYDSVASIDPDAHWLQMGWMFYNDRRHWTPERVKAYLQAIPQGKVTILDYYTENIPVWEQTESFYGQPFIFCYLGNFGGNTRLSGPFRKESERITRGLGAGASGIGCTLEGFGINRWFFEYVMDRAWESPRTDNDWLLSLDRRRGAPEGFSKEMADSIYLRGSFSEGPLICGRPCQEGYHHWTVIHPTPYDNATLVRKWKWLLDNPAPGHSWAADAVTLGTQALGNHFATLRDGFTAAVRGKDRDQAAWLASEMQDLLADADTLAACLPEFRLDTWLDAAESWGADPEEKAFYRHNAWHLVTTWGDSPILNDYASRLWSGLIGQYYAPRWTLFLEETLSSMDDGIPFSQEAFDRKCSALEQQKVLEAPQVSCPPPAKDVSALCKDLYHKWFEQL